MASFSHLPYELLLQIFTSLPTFQSAISLARTSYTLRQIWLHNTRLIASQTLSSSIPEYEEALALALLEVESLSHPEPWEAHMWLPILLKNAESATTIKTKWLAFLDRFPGCGYKNTSVHKAYYIVRQAVLSRGKDEIVQMVQSKLWNMTIEDLESTSEICWVMGNLLREKKETEDKAEWVFVEEMIDSALKEKRAVKIEVDEEEEEIVLL